MLVIENKIERREDRRIQRTKQLLRDSLMVLILKNQAWEPISIQDITDQANVSRSTFYLHYKDKEDLMFRSMEEIYDSLLTHYDQIKATNTLIDVTALDAVDFIHVAQFSEFYRIMLGPKGSGAFVARIHRYLARVFKEYILSPYIAGSGSTPAFSVDYIAHFIAGAEIGLIRHWLDTGMKESPQEMARMVDHLCICGSWETLGLSRPANWPQPFDNSGKT